jgi:hypothetical protein
VTTPGQGQTEQCFVSRIAPPHARQGGAGRHVVFGKGWRGQHAEKHGKPVANSYFFVKRP